MYTHYTLLVCAATFSSPSTFSCLYQALSTSRCKKVASRLYFLKQLKRVNIPAKDLLIFYLTCIIPVMEYACPVFQSALPAYLSAELEQLQKGAKQIIFLFLPFSDALHQANLETLSRYR